MEPYRPSNIIPLAGFAGLILAAVVGGGLIGALAGLIGEAFYLIILFPAVMGGAAGGLLELVVARAKVRSPIAALLAGLLAAGCVYASMYLVEYAFFLGRALPNIQTDLGAANTTEAYQVLDLYLSQEVGQTGFLGYILMRAQQGISIGRFIGSGAVTLAGPLFWLYWLVEIGIIAGIACWMAIGQANEPFCESCETWYGGEVGLGGLPEQESASLRPLLDRSDWRAVGAQMHANIAIPAWAFYFQRCPGCTTTPAHLILKRLSAGDRGSIESNVLYKGMISPSNLSYLLMGLAEGRAKDEAALLASEEDRRATPST